MKKLLNSLISVWFLFTPMYADIQFRLANYFDVNQIQTLYDDFSEDDKNKLLVFPAKMQKKIIAKNIKNKRIFVAVDENTKNIISFLKLHIIDQDEIDEILDEELCLGLASPLIEDCCYEFSTNILNNFKLPLRRILMTRRISKYLLSKTEKELIRSGKLFSCLYLYHGSAYTLPLYRGKGISTNLLAYAFNTIREYFFDKKHIILLYGQVNDNIHNVAMIRVFASCISNVFPNQTINGIKLQHLCCRAYKPDFDNNGTLKIFKDEKHRGLGNMVIYSAKNN